MVLINLPDGKIVVCRNLRPLLDRARSKCIDKVEISSDELTYGGRMTVTYSDKSIGTADFADANVLRYWVNARRSWHGIPFVDNGVEKILGHI